MKKVLTLISLLVLSVVCHSRETCDTLTIVPCREETALYTMTEQDTVFGIMGLMKNSRYYKMTCVATGYTEEKVDRIMKFATKLIFSSTRKDTVNTYNFTYQSLDVDGQPITLSAKLYIPSKAISSGCILKGLILGNRPTLTRDEESPTHSEQIEGAMAWKGYAVVVPDCVGFGVDAANPQAILHTELTGRNNVDATLAARQIIEDMHLSCEPELVNIGYSLGGTMAVATLKYAIEHPEKQLMYTKTFAGGGAYDFGVCYDTYIAGYYPVARRFMMLAIVSLIEVDKLGLNYANVFKEPLLSNYQDWILSKKYDVFEIIDFIGKRTPVAEILAKGISEKSSYEYEILYQAMSAQNLTGGMSVPDEAELFVIHSNVDNYVPYENFTLLQESVTGKNVYFISGDYGGHLKATLQYGKIMMKNLK